MVKAISNKKLNEEHGRRSTKACISEESALVEWCGRDFFDYGNKWTERLVDSDCLCFKRLDKTQLGQLNDIVGSMLMLARKWVRVNYG